MASNYILNLPLYYISFQPKKEVEEHYLNHGFTSVNHFPAVNGRKLSIDKLLSENIITIRCYDDLKYGRTQHSGMSSLGGIGCTMSHYELWEKCIKNNWKHLIIVEDDNRMQRKLNSGDFERIFNIISKPNTIFVSTVPKPFENYKVHFLGLHFYIINTESCKALVKKCFPIDVQTDWYISHLATIGDVKVEGFHVAEPLFHKSSIQDMCISCIFPKKQWFYIGIIASIILFLSGTVYYFRKYRECSSSCPG